MLEEEVTEFLGRLKSARRSDCDSGYRNGYTPPRKLTLSSGTIRVRRPRVRDTDEQFESRISRVADLIPELYPHGLSEGDFDLALRGLRGEDAPVSVSTVARLKDRWNAEFAEWSPRRLDDLEVVYMWVDGVYMKAGLEREGGGTGGDRGVERRDQGGAERCSRLQGVDTELVGRTEGPQRTGNELSETGGWGRTPGHLGSASQRLP